ncbi:MAG: hypothetical protein K2Q15_10270 [Burkholderiales bacterium]|nr:hypothetical protein [Burkholderiales bacterium]
MKIALLICSLCLAFASGFLFARERAVQAQKKETAVKIARQQQSAEAALHALRKQQIAQQQRQVLQLEQLEQQFRDYREQLPQRIILPIAWRVQHDRATHLPASSPATAPALNQAGATNDLAALSTVSLNYASCLSWREALEGWQQWYAIVSTQ